MQLRAVIAPPSGAMDDCQAILHDIFTPTTVETPARGLVGRLRKRGAVPVPEVEWQPNLADAVVVGVAKFGHVTRADTQDLIAALEKSARDWAAPEVRVADIHVGETEPFAVAARLTGGLDALVGLFRNVLGVAQQQGFFLDRRSFRSEVALGTITVPPGAAVPESLPGVVIPVHGPTWTISHLQLVRVSLNEMDTVMDEVAAIRLGRIS